MVSSEGMGSNFYNSILLSLKSVNFKKGISPEFIRFTVDGLVIRRMFAMLRIIYGSDSHIGRTLPEA